MELVVWLRLGLGLGLIVDRTRIELGVPIIH